MRPDSRYEYVLANRRFHRRHLDALVAEDWEERRWLWMAEWFGSVPSWP